MLEAKTQLQDERFNYLNQVF